jgi:hypothetical protein
MARRWCMICEAAIFIEGRLIVRANSKLILLARPVFHLETAANLLELLEPVLTVFSKYALQLLDNQADFDSAIPRFESWRPSQSKR